MKRELRGLGVYARERSAAGKQRQRRYRMRPARTPGLRLIWDDDARCAECRRIEALAVMRNETPPPPCNHVG